MRHERKITRLRDYDYRQNGAYAVTICTHERRLAFGRIEDSVARLHPFGLIAQECWLAIPRHFPQVELDEFIVMPNHVHGILFITSGLAHEPGTLVPREFARPQKGSLGTIIGRFKSAVTQQIGERRECPTRVWQGRFYEHIIRNDQDLENHREYILNNPSKWLEDELHPSVSTRASVGT